MKRLEGEAGRAVHLQRDSMFSVLSRSPSGESDGEEQLDLVRCGVGAFLRKEHFLRCLQTSDNLAEEDLQ